MAFGPNRAAAKPRATFTAAGGVIIKFRHPLLTGQVSGAVQTDEIDVSRAVRLNDTFFNASPSQDSAFMEALVDGSTITITNHMLAGTATIQVVRTTGLVGTGDFVAAAHLIIASKDTEGGTLTVIKSMQGKRIIRVYYGVSFKNVPHDIIAGNAIVPFPVVMNYAGWFEGVGAADLNEKTIWAVGNKHGLRGQYRPYAVQDAENVADFYAGAPASNVIGGVDAGDQDTADGDLDTVAVVPDVQADGVVSEATLETTTWE